MATALGQFAQAQAYARSRNQARLNQATALYDAIIAQYSGGENSPLMKSVNKQLEIGGRRALSSGMSNLVAAGLSGTTMAATLGNRYEEEVGAPTRLNAMDTIAQRLASAQMAKAGVLERVEDTVDTSQFGNLMQAANSGVPDNFGNSEFYARSGMTPAQLGYGGSGGGSSGGYGGGSTKRYVAPTKSSYAPTGRFNVFAEGPSTPIRDSGSQRNLNTSFLADAASRTYKAAPAKYSSISPDFANLGKNTSFSSYAGMTPLLNSMGW